jgi:aspartyl-tRNA(Asn)/glutamyl-tRNA(Gln) amidotransferase subunit C
MVDKKVVEYVAMLARIKVSDEEKEFLSSQLSKILDYIGKLNELDVESAEPLKNLGLENNVFRKDKAIAFALEANILKNSPSRQENYFKVPKVIE